MLFLTSRSIYMNLVIANLIVSTMSCGCGLNSPTTSISHLSLYVSIQYEFWNESRGDLGKYILY
jgi:hypothetical protein